MTASTYKWATRGDINAFFALFLDNVVNLFVLSAILTGFGMPKEFVYTRIIPGTAIGVMVGDLLYNALMQSYEDYLIDHANSGGR